MELIKAFQANVAVHPEYVARIALKMHEHLKNTCHGVMNITVPPVALVPFCGVNIVAERKVDCSGRYSWTTY